MKDIHPDVTVANPEHPLIEATTQIVAKNYPTVTGDLFALLVAHELFNQLKLQSLSAPDSTFKTLCHAQTAVDKQIKAFTL